ncbi:MAG: hypothetical protein AAF717_08940 [Bacteroidota bacterium]
MKKLLLVCILFSFLAVEGQKTIVKAVQGDGIFSMLRKQGLDPVKYYADFVTLNKDNLKNGSELYLGRSYIIPDAPDSFKKMAVALETHSDSESAIFDEKELAQVSPKSKRLRNAVIYLLSGENFAENSGKLRDLEKQVMERLASQLMVHGARVYLLENDSIRKESRFTVESEQFDLERPIGNHKQMQYYVDAINQRYLKNQSKYQRVLVMSLDKSFVNNTYFGVSIFHHGNSPEGEHFASSLQAIFNESSSSEQEGTEIFKNDRNLFLVKNVLPPVTMITIHNAKDAQVKGRNKRALTEIITSGVLKDYAELSFQED